MLLQHVRLVPDSEVPTSFNHLVGAGEQRGGQFQAKRRGRLQVYDELKFRWLRHRQVRGLFPLENPADVNAGLAKTIGKAGSVTHQAAAGDEIPMWVHRGNGMARGQRHELFKPAEEEWVVADKQRADPLLDEGYEGRVELAFAAGVQNMEF